MYQRVINAWLARCCICHVKLNHLYNVGEGIYIEMGLFSLTSTYLVVRKWNC